MDYPNLKQIRVLFVDDNETIREVAIAILSERVKELFIAENGEEGLELYKARRPDVVITDIKMPKMNGLNMADAIKEINEHAKIVILTSLDDPNILIRAINVGIATFLSKPLVAHKLLETLEKRAVSCVSKQRHTEDKNLLEGYKYAVDAGTLVSKTDINGIITYANDEFCNIAGYTYDELVGNPHNIVRHPDMPKEIFEDLWTTIKAKKVWKGELKNRAKDGSAYYVKTTIVPMLDENGETLEYLGLRQDITELELLNHELERRVAEEVEKNSQKEKQLLDSLRKIFDASPNPIVVFRDAKVSFLNKEFMTMSGLSEGMLLDHAFDMSSIFEKRQGFIKCVDEIDDTIDRNKVSVASKRGRNIYNVIKSSVELPFDESIEIFTFNNITISEYQKIKLVSYNSRLEDYIKAMRKNTKKTEENIPDAVEVKTSVLKEQTQTSVPITEAVKEELVKNSRSLKEEERMILKRSRLNAEISSADYASEIDEYVLQEMQELGELETEIHEALLHFEDKKSVQFLHQVAEKLSKYASTINQLFEFGDLAFSIGSLSNLLMLLQENELDDTKIRKIELYLTNILLDIASWRQTIFVEQSANDIHYLDASLFSAILQLELVFNEGQNIEEDDDDFELF